MQSRHEGSTQAESDARSSEKQANKARVQLRALLMLIGLVIAVALRNCRDIVTAIALKFPTILELMSARNRDRNNQRFWCFSGGSRYPCVCRFPFGFHREFCCLSCFGRRINPWSLQDNLKVVVQLSLWANCLGVAAPLVAIIVAILWPKSKQPD